MNVKRMGTAGLMGWRAKVGDAVAEPVARHSRLEPDDVREIVGWVFFALASLYVVRALKTAMRRT